MANHGHENGHSHGENAEYYSKRAQAMQALLIEKGVCTLDDILTMADKIDSRSPEDGAKILAHAWVDPEYKKRLLANAEAAFLELGYDLPETSPKITVLENTNDIHNMAVCTLCSCFPRAIIGRPPAWYKELSYRSKVVVDPRGVLQEFGTVLDEAVQVRVIDSSADYRYLILPNRPAGTENMTEEELAKLITQESMIGVGLALSPESVSAG
ncbi:MAG TPA: nitrile hydratase subunit alpha [Dehalococcoidia bacterium]|nr:nitrile hydratase subunit alpha [Dehalococcoidia bacterium]